MVTRHLPSRRAALRASISLLALVLASGAAHAQNATDIGAVSAQGTGTGGVALSSPVAIGSKAPAGSAPALAPAQGSLEAFEPGSQISDKVIRDMIPPTSDYNEAAKFTPGFISNNTNGLMGDTKGGWRGYQDGQYNITFDGIPFGDANDPTHHSNAYFPATFIGSMTIDRGPGAASQVGYATFGGTMAMNSVDLASVFGGNVSSSIGSFATMKNTLTVQTGELGELNARGVFQYAHANTAGALQDGKVNQDQFLGKMEKRVGDDFRITVFASYGLEDYNNVNPITWPQLQQYGKTYGEVNNNPKTQQYVDYNNSEKQTDMEYIGLTGTVDDVWHVDNKLYTYSYWYPNYQNNGADQTIEGLASTTNGGTITSVSIPTITGGKTKVNILGVANGDVTGYIKYNNYRAWGDIFKIERDIDAGFASGTLRAGIWAERVDNERLQEYIDYTTGQTYTQLGNSMQASYKLNLDSHINNVQPFVEYDWQPIAGLTITPGYKYEAFTRNHDALVNQTTLQAINYDHTYAASLPFLSVRYKVTPEITAYAQASQGMLAPTVSAYYVFNPAIAGIKPQTTTNFQAGAVYKTARLTADADIYQVTAKNFPIQTNLSTGQQIYQDGGTAQYRGVEAEGTYTVLPNLAAYGSGALIQAKYTQGQFSGMRVGDAPDYTAAGGLIYDDGMFFGSLMQKFVGGAYGSSGQKANSSTTNASLNYVAAYNTTDLVVGVRSTYLQGLGIGKSAELKLGVYNALDHKNISEIAGDPSKIGSTSINNTTLTYAFLPGRLVIGSLSIDF